MTGKLDGTRALVYKEGNKITIINRRDVILNSRYPELLEIVNDIRVDTAILDGEIILVDEKGIPNFYKLAEREHVDSEFRVKLLSETMPATYVVFDILRINGQELINKLLINRKKILGKIIKESEKIKLCFYTEDGEKLFRVTKKMRIEGIIGKQKQSSYYPGERKDYWLKMKHLKTLDIVIVGYTSGTGKRGELLGSLIAGCYHKGKLKYAGKIGTGFSEQQLKELLERLEKLKVEKCPFPEEPELKLPPERKPIWTKPKLVCEVKFLELTEDKIMRTPSFLRLRNDKKPEECTLEA